MSTVALVAAGRACPAAENTEIDKRTRLPAFAVDDVSSA